MSKKIDTKDIFMNIGLNMIGAVAQVGLNEIMNSKHESERIKWCATHIYDKKFDITYSLRRPMTNDEKVEYSERVKNGENVGTVLKAMKLLKHRKHK